jgi:CHAT domain-containing protein/tetratricopeptide (TPR) repeat protein
LAFLARLAIEKHGDAWLSDLLSSSESRGFPQAVVALSQSMKANEAGDYLSARTFASQAEQLFDIGGNKAGVLRSRLEAMFALHLSHDGKRCLVAGGNWAKEIESSAYPWVRAQFGLDYGNCIGISGKYGDAQRTISKAMEVAKANGYGSAYLRGLGFASDLASTLGNVREGWARAYAGLDSYWSGMYRPMLGYNLYTDLDTAAEARKQPHLQVAIWQQALALISSDNDPLLRAMAHSWMGKSAVAARMPDTAQSEFAEASRWFAAAPQNEVSRNDWVEAQTMLAQLEAQRGDRQVAYERLSRIEPAINIQSNNYLAIRYYAVRGVVEFDRQMTSDAERSLRSAVALAERTLKSLGSDRERSLWNEEASEGYRHLAQARLEQGDSQTALEIWEWYRGAALRYGQHSLGSETLLDAAQTANDLDAGALVDGPSLPSLNEVARSLPTLQNETVISYGMFGASFWIWAYDDRGILAKKGAVSADEVGALANRFADLCSNPDSDQSAIQRDGIRLYELLLEPVEERLSKRRKLVFELDGEIARVPMEALLDRNATYLIDRSSVAISPGIYYSRAVRQDSEISPNAKTLIVSVPAPSVPLSYGMLPLLDAKREAEIVANGFRASRLLEGSDAKLEVVGKLIGDVDVFHFAGHAMSSEDSIGLVLSDTDPGTNPKTLDATFIEEQRPLRMQLAVLSACATESTEAAGRTANDLGLAFMRSGVPHVVGSRWNVDSSATAALMQKFYESLFTRKSVSESLRSAEVAVRSLPGFAHPYFWASFETLGTP